uniref:Uncharacterized protein n=1 Tax=Nelumbo nucifera TaxID=4432 RepID=A0A822ZVS5_NELNU|nr:TPA_asm: hypothetical protein HUJ06_017372 [Nelumbo nucifera]
MITLSSHAKLIRKVHLFKVMKKHKYTKMNCTITADLGTIKICNLSCLRWISSCTVLITRSSSTYGGGYLFLFSFFSFLSLLFLSLNSQSHVSSPPLQRAPPPSVTLSLSLSLPSYYSNGNREASVIVSDVFSDVASSPLTPLSICFWRVEPDPNTSSC